ncbi:type II secretion system protein [Candidatus Falkowbacteria bacterium]|nr:type II secretion system protein [Candidatus Falkowbacteria bacterium]
MFKLKNKLGFTLLELLVTISIIAFLSVLSFAVYENTRIKTRDTQRLAGIRRIQEALDLYWDKNGTFPQSRVCGATKPNVSWCNSVESLVGEHWIFNSGVENLEDYLSVDPLDPNNSPPATIPLWKPFLGGAYYYYSGSWASCQGKDWYFIVFGLEDTNHAFQLEDGVTACNGSFIHYGVGANNDGIITIGKNYN